MVRIIVTHQQKFRFDIKMNIFKIKPKKTFKFIWEIDKLIIDL